MTLAPTEPSDPLAIPTPRLADYAASARAELDAFVQLLESLGPDDWTRPTPCSLWNVHDVVAHQAGHIQSGAGFGGLLAQVNPIALRAYRKRGLSMLDAMNQKQVDVRRSDTPQALIEELRAGTPRAIERRGRLNFLAGQVRVPVPPVGMMPVKTLLHRVFPRDMWIHRLDISDATGRDLATGDNDRLLLALTVQDAARLVRQAAPELSLVLRIAGPAGGTWRLAAGTGPTTELEMSLPVFMRRSSGRASSQETLSQVTAASGNEETLARAVELLAAPY
jgi:uncharacterized protein (TIGR03083 family)